MGVGGGRVGGVVGVGGYWTLQQQNFRAQHEEAEQQAWQHAGHISQAVTVQVQTLLSGFDHSLRVLQDHYQEGNWADFERQVQATFASYPQGALVQIGVANAAGVIVYTSLHPMAGQPTVSIAEREHFRVHQAQAGTGLFIGKPVQGKVSGQWSIQLSRALRQAGKFQGVLILSVSPDYIARNFRDMAFGAKNAISLVRMDGFFLARSQLLQDMMGHSVPPERMQLFAAGGDRGTYTFTAPVDGVERMYAWMIVPNTHLVVLVGLERQAILAPVRAYIERSTRRDLLASALLLLGGALIVWLVRQRQRSERLRTRDEERFAQLVREVPGGLFQYGTDAQGRRTLVFASPGFYALYGMREHHPADDPALLKTQLVQRVYAPDLPALRASIQVSVQNVAQWTHTYRVHGAQDEVIWLQGHACPHVEDDGTLLWHGYVHDVTRERALQQAIAANEERLRLTLKAVGDGLWQWDCVTGQVLWDARCRAMLGFAPEFFTMPYRVFLEQMHPADAVRFAQQLQRHLQTQEEFRVEIRLRQHNGSWLWVESRGELAQRSSDGTPLRMMGTHMDIQQRVEKDHLVHALLDRGSTLTLVSTQERCIVYANTRAAQVLGLPVGVQLGESSFCLLLANEDGSVPCTQFYETLGLQGSLHTESALRLPDGRSCWFDIQACLLDPSDAEGKMIWTLFDIDARRRAETAWRQTQQRLEALMEHFPVGILMTDGSEERIVGVNAQFVRVLGLAQLPQELEGMRVPELQEQVGAALLSMPGPSAGAKLVHLLDDGRYLEVQTLVLQEHHQQQRLGVCWLVSDVTERKQREQRLQTLALTDTLTGAPNRRAFFERMDMELLHLQNGLVDAAALLMLDIDHFKRVNDTYGHAVGDVVLKMLVGTVLGELGKDDMLGRIGGEEFAVLFSATTALAGLQRAEGLRQAVAASVVEVEGLAPIHYAISLGVCALEPGATGVDEYMARADAALYHSKRNGRNQSTLWHPHLMTVMP